MALKYGSEGISALKFDKPLVETGLTPIVITCNEYNFLQDWELNPNQPEDGIEVTEHTITVRKFKPNEWLIKSNYEDTSREDYLERFLLKDWSISGIKTNVRFLSGSTVHPQGPDYYAYGLIITPCADTGRLLSSVWPWEMNIPNGYFKKNDILPSGDWGAKQFGYYGDFVNCPLFNYPVYYTSDYNQKFHQVALAVFTSNEPDQDGFITLSSTTCNPSSVESFEGYLDGNKVYDKPKTFENILSAYSFVSREVGEYDERIQNKKYVIPSGSTWGGVDHIAFVLKNSAYTGMYDTIHLPEVIDFGNLIQESFPFKVWGHFETISGDSYSNIWDSISEAFSSNTITNAYFTNHLFAKSGGGKIENLVLNFDCTYPTGEDSFIDLYGIFDHSDGVAKNIHFNIINGKVMSLTQSFRSFQGAENITFSKPVQVADWSGAFEGASLKNFPSNIVPWTRWRDDYGIDHCSEETCFMEYLADGSSLRVIGDYKDNNEYYSVLLDPQIRGLISRSSVEEIRYELDMKLVNPDNNDAMTGGVNSNSPFSAESLTTARIKNLNKGAWNLDGVVRNTHIAGNIPNLDAASTDFLLNNVFDLRQNDRTAGDTEHFLDQLNSFSGWSFSDNKWGGSDVEVYAYDDGCTISRNITSTIHSAMSINTYFANCKLYFTLNATPEIEITAATTTLSGINVGDTLVFRFEKIDHEEYMEGHIAISRSKRVRSELTPGLTYSNIYLPASLRDRASSSAIQTAQTRGWNVYFGGELEPTEN